METRLEGKVWLARAFLWWEALWDAAFPVIFIIALFAIAVLTGILAVLPDMARYVALGLFAIAFIWSLKSFWHFKAPGQAAALRRIEIESGLAHRPVSAAYDQLADPAASAASQEIWQAHKRRQLAAIKNLKIGMPRSSWLKLDQKALRVPVGLALLAAIFLHRGDPVSSLADAVRIAPPASAATLALDAWIKPPAYTGKPPIMLTSPATIERLAREGEITVPENSGLVVRLANASQPQVRFYALTDGPEPGAELKEVSFKAATEGGSLQGETKLLRPVYIKVTDGSSEIANWRISILPDAAPKVEFGGDPRGEAGGSLAVKWKASDDYGVSAITSDISLSDNQDGQIGIAGNGVFLFDPPQFPISLKKASPKEASGTSAADLTAHPWAGLNVNMQLQAVDASGKTGKSEVKTFKLPERDFFKPLARALIEQRKALVMNPDEPQPVERMLEALLAYPEGLIEESGQHIAIRMVHSMISHAPNHDDIKKAVDLLWQIAIAIEDGEVADAKRELDAIRKELEKALAEGAPPERIKELLRIMNWLAAPFGSEEDQLLTFGVKNIDYTLDEKGNPTLTQQGNADANYVPWKYIAQHPLVFYSPDLPDYAKVMYDTEHMMMPYAVSDPTFGQVSATDFSKGFTLTQKTNDGILDIVVGRRPLSEFDTLIKEWQTNGGEEIRKEYAQSIAASA